MKQFMRNGIVVRAVQFTLPRRPWPAGMKSWPKNGYQPRDTSWGYVETPKGDAHVCVGDWIVIGATGIKCVLSDQQFRQKYTPVLTKGTDS